MPEGSNNIGYRKKHQDNPKLFQIGSVIIALSLVGSAGQAWAQAERFEITSIKAVRPTLVNTIAALQAGDVARAKAAFEAYDSAWNGIEVYVNVRSKAMYQTLEHDYQARIAKALDAPNPNIVALLADAQVMLAKFDETVALIAPMPPLNSLYDDVARLRIVRAHLREVPPALKAGNFAKARKSFRPSTTTGTASKMSSRRARRLLCGDREGYDRDRKGAEARQSRRSTGYRHAQ